MNRKSFFITFGLLSFLVFIFSALYGAVEISFDEMNRALMSLFDSAVSPSLNERIFLEIRLPRAVMALIIGSSLAVGGVLMQGLFLNPIVEPGLVGTSSGAAFGAALSFTIGSALDLGEYALPVAAFLGGCLATFLVFFLAEKGVSRTNTISLLLVGIAINALFLSGVGFLSYIARDPQARSITFWNLGTISGANWHAVMIVGVTCIACLLIGLRYSNQLNAMMLGTAEAQSLGINIKRLKIKVLLVNVVLISVATAFVGVIGFVGLVVPHIVRILIGSDNKTLIWGSVWLGAILLSIADITSRLVLAPAELPIGIVTTIVGAPIFIYLLRKNEYLF